MARRAVPKPGRRGVGRPPKLELVVGKYYQITHDKLPSKTPFWLKFIKVVMVSDRNRMTFTVRFPSLNSLKTAEQTDSDPIMDMWFSMGVELARTVLRKEVAHPEFKDSNEFKDYWLLDSSSSLAPKLELDAGSPISLRSSTAIHCQEEKVDEIVEEKGGEIVEKKGGEIVEEKLQLVVFKDEKIKEEIADEDLLGKHVQKKKKPKYWSDQSYETGKGIILNILKEKKITADNPIIRAALRKEAQKQIGNTGLLDHLLKDLPGNIAPDGVSRFQRCYNADGVIMYWLESADLVDIRQKASVADPFWIPPPGWKIGACTTGCPCSKELELLKDDVEKIKRELEETKKLLNEVRAEDSRSSDKGSDLTKWVGGYW